jgi:hypothetical protein
MFMTHLGDLALATGDLDGAEAYLSKPRRR